MKQLLYLSAFCLALIPNLVRSTETNVARFYSLSITLPHAVNQYGDYFDINYSGQNESANELGVQWPNVFPDEIALPGPTNYVSNMTIYDSYYGYASSGALFISLPSLTDANNNRFPDFFEVSRGVSAQSAGSYYFWDSVYQFTDDGSISVTWSRTAGFRTGTCRMTFSDFTLSDPTYWGTFTSSFQIAEYTGTLAYTPGSNDISGNITLAQTGVPLNTRNGAIQFTKAPADRFNSLTNAVGAWTDASLQVYNFTNHYFFRDPAYPTNYAGYIELIDPLNLGVVQPYSSWLLSITDTNDVNHNGVPDFSEGV
jgi:hypothetical protein